jgi:hypothetical protein
MTRVPALGRRSQAQVPGARSGTRPGPPAPQICNFLSPRSFPTACRHDGTVSPPEPHRSLSVAPLIGDKRCYGEATVRLRRGQPQDRERRERARLPRSGGAQTAGLSISIEMVSACAKGLVGTRSTASLEQMGTRWNASLPVWLRLGRAAPYPRLPPSAGAGNGAGGRTPQCACRLPVGATTVWLRTRHRTHVREH